MMRNPTDKTASSLTASIDELVVAIIINRQYPRVENKDDLYQATRSMWRVNTKRANKARYAFAVYQGEIKEVYEIDHWEPATEATREYWRKREKLQDDDFRDTHDGRSEFTGRVAPEVIRNKYVDKHIPRRSFGAPILYFNC
jgi:hypothetical protein